MTIACLYVNLHHSHGGFQSKAFLHTIYSFTCFHNFISNESAQRCRQMTLPIIFLQHKAYRWSPQVPAWKTADLRGTSCLINSRRKRECFPCTDWYTPPFASLASRDIRPCTSRVAKRYGNSGTTCSNTGLVCDLSVRTVSLFMWQYLNPPRLEFRPLRHPLWKWALMISWASLRKTQEMKGTRRQNLTQMHRDVWKLLKDLIL